MNTTKTNPFLIAVLHTVLTFAGTFGMIYVLSLIDKVPFLDKAKDPVMLAVMIAGPLVAGVSAFMKARKDRLAVSAA